MKNNAPQDIENLVAKAFVLEAVADKVDCTSRSTDLPGKPLEDFIIAGINSAPFFVKLAQDRFKGSKSVYTYFAAALKASNNHKSSKYINFGLLEIMFPVVAARIACDKPKQVVKTINKVLAETSKRDVDCMLGARRIAWSTSNNARKLKVELQLVANMGAKNVAQFYDLQHKLGEIGTSSKQWTDEYVRNWPLLEEMFNGLNKSKEANLLDKITGVFNPIREKNKDIRIGVLADMCAAAIFLHLSYTK